MCLIEYVQASDSSNKKAGRMQLGKSLWLFYPCKVSIPFSSYGSFECVEAQHAVFD